MIFFFLIFERKKKPDELIVVNESVGTSSTFKAFLMYINCYIFLLMIFSVQTKHHQQCSWRYNATKVL